MTAEEYTFLAAYVTTQDAVAAFRAAFDPASQIPEDEVKAQATTLLHRSDMLVSMENYNRNVLLKELEEARQKAMKENGGAQAAVAATMGKAHLFGVRPQAMPVVILSPADPGEETVGAPNGKAH